MNEYLKVQLIIDISIMAPGLSNFFFLELRITSASWNYFFCTLPSVFIFVIIELIERWFDCLIFQNLLLPEDVLFVLQSKNVGLIL